MDWDCGIFGADVIFKTLSLGLLLMNAITVNEAQNDLTRIIEQVSSDAEPTIICGEQGQKAVLLSLEEFNAWQETIYLLSSPANADHLRQSIAETKDEKVVAPAL